MGSFELTASSFQLGDWVRVAELSLIGQVVRFIRNKFVEVKVSELESYVCHYKKLEAQSRKLKAGGSNVLSLQRNVRAQ